MHAPLFRISDTVFDPSAGELRRDDEILRLSPKAGETLTVLCERAGHVVSKEILLARVWPDAHVTDDGLWHAIAELRRAFGDKARQARTIETLPRRGYRLIAPTQAMPSELVAADGPWISGLETNPEGSDTIEAENAEPGSAESANGLGASYDSAGISAGISRDDSDDPGALPFEALPTRVGRRIGRGTRRRTRRRIYWAAALVVLSSLFISTWAASTWAASAWAALAGRLEPSPPESSQLELSQPATRAESLLEQGIEAFSKYSSGHNERAIELLEAAVDAAPDQAPARAALADAYAMKGLYFSTEPWWRDQAVAEAERAAELDPDLPEAFKALGLARVAVGETSAARQAYLRAIELRPNYAPALNNLALLESGQGHLARAVRFMERASAARPDDLTYLTNVATGYRLLGLEARAVAILDAAAGEPGFENGPAIAWQRALLDLSRGAGEAARLRLEAALERAPRDRDLMIHAAELALHQGRRRAALDLLERAIPQDGPVDLRSAWLRSAAAGDLERHELNAPELNARDLDGHRAVLESLAREILAASDSEEDRWRASRAHARAVAHQALGEIESTLLWLGYAVDAGYREAFCLGFDPVFDSLHGHPTFQGLLDRTRELVAEERRVFLEASTSPLPSRVERERSRLGESVRRLTHGDA